MRKSVLAVLIAFALVLGFASIADAAPKKTYKVTLTTTSVSEAGKFVTVSGKVTGPKAAGATVTIQRQYAGGPWTTVTVATIKKNGAYSARVETPRGGNTSFRALKAKSSAAKAGTSPTRTMKVYEWLYLANQGDDRTGPITEPVEQKIGSTLYRRSIGFFDGDAAIGYKLGGLCTKLTTRAAYFTYGTVAPNQVTFTLTRRSSSATTTQLTFLDLETSTAVATSLVGTSILSLQMDGIDSGNDAALGDPKVYCNADRLPSITAEDMR